MSKFKAIFFDLDGTLMETAYEIADAVNDTMSNFDLNSVDEEECKTWIGHGTLHLMLLAISKVKSISYEEAKNDSQTNELYDYFKLRYFERTGTRSWLFDGALELLQELKNNNIQTAVITNKEEAFVKKILKAHNLDTLLDLVVSGDTLDVKKPNPKGIFHIMHKLNIANNKDVLFIGDSNTDIVTAQNAGLECWAVPYGYNAGERIQDSNPDKMIDKLSDIPKLIEL